MKAEQTLQTTKLWNEILNIQIKLMEAKELMNDINMSLINLEETTFDILNTTAEMKELTKEMKNKI
jgi:hypothetical protein